MSETSQGPGWWVASDGRWYPPELHPHAALPSPPISPGVPPYGQAVPPFGQGAPDPLQAPRPQAYSPVATAAPGGRFGRGLRLVRVGFTMVGDEPGLLAVPVVAFVVQLLIIGAGALLVLPGLTDGQAAGSSSRPGGLSAGHWAALVAVGIAVMFVSVVSHATIIARVMARFHGQGMTNRQALSAALSKSPQLLVWAVVNYVVMTVIRNLRSRGILGLLVSSAAAVAWMLASFFVVPVILYEHLGPFAAVKRSTSLCRQRWGENIVGNSAISVIAFVAIMADVVAAAVLGSIFAPVGVVVGVVGLAAILLVVTVAASAFNAALYWFAVTGESPGQYSAGDLGAAYRTSRRRSGILGF